MGCDVSAAYAVAWLRSVGQSSSDWLGFDMSVVSSLLDSLLIITNATKPCSDWLWINNHAVNLASLPSPSTLLPKMLLENNAKFGSRTQLSIDLEERFRQ